MTKAMRPVLPQQTPETTAVLVPPAAVEPYARSKQTYEKLCRSIGTLPGPNSSGAADGAARLCCDPATRVGPTQQPATMAWNS